MAFSAFLAAAALLRSAEPAGLPVGGRVAAYEPIHATGPDADTNTCPVCKYGALPAIQAWIEPSSPEAETKALLAALNKIGERHAKAELHVFAVFTKDDRQPMTAFVQGLKELGKPFPHVSLLVVPASDQAREDYGLVGRAPFRHVTMTYRRGIVSGRFINLDPAKASDLEATVTKMLKD